MTLQRLSTHLYRFTDTCNVYLLTDGDAGLLIDAGSGAILDHLVPTGVAQIEWVLHTHHHRDQCWGTPRLQHHGAKVAVPEYERHLFDQAELFWQTRRTFDNYNDRNTFFTIGKDIAVDAVLEDYESFTWRGYRFYVLPAKGHTFGSSALLADIDGRRVAFTGDLLAAGGKLYQLHATEYTYGSMEGILFTLQASQALRKQKPDLCLPSHGAAIDDVPGDLDRLQRRLMDCVRLGRGSRVAGRDSIPETIFLPDSKFIPLSRHLLWGGVWTCSNFYVILSDSGKALFVDYGHAYWGHMHISHDHDGLETMRFIEHHLDELREEYGVTAFDLVIPTHIHDDHTCGIPFLQKHHGTRCWALAEVAQVLADPAAWASTPCTFPKPIRIDRVLQDGERFQWEEYDFEIHFAPGQTEYHSVYAAQIDGRKVAFTGDNIFLNEVVAGGKTELSYYQTTVLRNSFQLAMHRRCAEVMRKLSPELVCPGHREVLPCFKKDIDAYCDYITRKERVFRELVGEPSDHYIDLFWARLLPYLAVVQPGQTIEYRLLLRNNLEKPVTYAARLLPPHGWETSPELTTLPLGPGAHGELVLRATAPATGDNTRRLLTAEIAIDGVNQGPISEALVTVRRG
ncbi:MAG: MBL fold metallo-hydrolase [Planctomycetia bacterium]|nr:MBL fold metallo-hydrolase [Planctomycetia bacterium]